MKPLAALFLLLSAIVFSRADGADPGLWPGTRYDAAIPTHDAVLGFGVGEHLSSPAEVRRYFEALAAAAPERMKLVPYATSWEGRELFYAVIARPELFERLDAIQADVQRVAHLGEGADGAVEALPATVWLSYSVHGNEVSSSDAAMFTAYHLLAARNDPVAEEILADAVVFVDPLQNPDGRARFVQSFEAALGLSPRATRLAAEHDEPWPSGRVNHYLFDLNRDWLPVTQPETIGRIDALREWYPLVYVDAHEMGSDSTYFFAPEAVPYNPHLVPAQKENLELFGRNNAAWFDRFGFPYFTREVYDAFYPGYGASWPSYYGAIAMTYEQASPRGLVIRRRDGSELTYRDAVRHHFVASISTAQAAAANHEHLWAAFLDYRRSAVAEGEREAVRAWALPTQTDQGAADRLARLLARHGVAVYRIDETTRACGRDLAPGAWVVPLAQPAKRFVRVALDPDVPMDEAFLAEQEARRARDLPDEIYDVTAWSLPLMFNVETVACDRAPALAGLARAGSTAPARQGTIAGAVEDAVAFLVPGGDRATLALLAGALEAGLAVRAAEEAFTVAGETWPAGTLVIPVAANEPELAKTLRRLARTSGARVTGLGTTWVEDGPSFGSRRMPRLTAPRVALAWDAPTSAYSAGATRFVVERKFGYPITPVRTRTLARAPLDGFDVIILPDAWGGAAGYRRVLGDGGAERLRRWVAAGGVLITVGGGTAWAAHEDVDLLPMRLEDQPGADEEEDEDEPEPTRVPGRELATAEALREAIRPEREAPDSLAGILARAEVDGEHWLGAGIAPTVNVLVRGDRIFTPLTLDAGTNVARFAGPEALVASGYAWEETRRQLAYKPFVVARPLGDGQLVAFTNDPTVRAYLDGLEPLLLSAILKGPAYTDRLR